MSSGTLSIPSVTASNIRWHNCTWLVCRHTRAFSAYLNIECWRWARCKKPRCSHLSNKMSLGVLWNGVLPRGGTSEVSRRHHRGVFYLCFPKGYTWEVAKELENLALGPQTGLHPSWIHPAVVCRVTLPAERSRIHPGVWSGTGSSVLYNQPIPHSGEELRLNDFSVYLYLCRFLMAGRVFFLPNWKAVTSQTYLKKLKESFGAFLPLL